uniref:glucan endo-1,3-beta-D-glucosidase n=1 Tax=Quercus lobata TaxID=97700 RepID=A0A7N2MUL8_QUELO
MIGDNLPPPTEVIQLYKQYGISKLRLFDPNPAALEALRGSQIVVTLGIRNEDLPGLAASQAAVESWFAINVQPYLNDVVFGYISVGNEVIPGSLGNYVLPVMQFLQNILIARNLANVKVTTVVPASVLGTSYPPSAGAFTAEARTVMVDILKFLSDGALGYSNLFDAIVDAFYSAMERAGVADVNVAVSESGWPSAGNGELTTPSLAATYNKNFIQHILVKNGTPKRPNINIEGFIFAMFIVNQKPVGVEQNFGLFFPDKTPVYPVFTPQVSK